MLRSAGDDTLDGGLNNDLNTPIVGVRWIRFYQLIFY